MPEYYELIEKVRNQKYPVKIKFGLEICYFKEYETFIGEMTKDKGVDFLLGSIHFVDKFAFDHKPEHWIGIDVDTICLYGQFTRADFNDTTIGHDK